MKYFFPFFFILFSCQFIYNNESKKDFFSKEDFKEVFEGTKEILGKNGFLIDFNLNPYAIEDTLSIDDPVGRGSSMNNIYGIPCTKCRNGNYSCKLYSTVCGLRYRYAENKFLVMSFFISGRKDYNDIKDFMDECVAAPLLIDLKERNYFLNKQNIFIYFSLPNDFEKTHLLEDIKKCEKLIKEDYQKFLNNKGIKLQ